jgi:hypothetical protein
MEKEVHVGDHVECWMLTPKKLEGKWVGEVLKVDLDKKRSFLVTRPKYPNIEISIKEIWQVIQKEINGN